MCVGIYTHMCMHAHTNFIHMQNRHRKKNSKLDEVARAISVLGMKRWEGQEIKANLSYTVILRPA